MEKGREACGGGEPGLREHEKEMIRSIGRRVEYKRGQFIISPGSSPEAVCLIESGLVGLYPEGKKSRAAVGGTLGPGELLGLAEAFLGHGETFRAAAISDVSLVSISKEEFYNLLSCDPFFLRRILGVLACRMGTEESIIYSMIFGDVEALCMKNH